jgi:hypothetical protein
MLEGSRIKLGDVKFDVYGWRRLCRGGKYSLGGVELVVSTCLERNGDYD